MGDKLTVEDIGAMLRGHNAFLSALGKVFPGASVEELVQKAQEIEGSSVAQELLYMVLTDRKVKL